MTTDFERLKKIELASIVGPMVAEVLLRDGMKSAKTVIVTVKRAGDLITVEHDLPHATQSAQIGGEE